MNIELERLKIRPGDRLVARIDRDIVSEAEAAEVKERLRRALALDWDIPIVIVTREWNLYVEDA